jgi:hypothetical protein
MNTFLLGMLAGVGIFGIIVIMVTVFKVSQEIAMIHRIVQILGLKINKIEKVTQSTMVAAENFVDALQQSAEQFQQHYRKAEPNDDFGDLRESFEEGIRKFEEEETDEDEDNWKKKT